MPSSCLSAPWQPWLKWIPTPPEEDVWIPCRLLGCCVFLLVTFQRHRVRLWFFVGTCKKASICENISWEVNRWTELWDPIVTNGTSQIHQVWKGQQTCGNKMMRSRWVKKHIKSSDLFYEFVESNYWTFQVLWFCGSIHSQDATMWVSEKWQVFFLNSVQKFKGVEVHSSSFMMDLIFRMSSLSLGHPRMSGFHGFRSQAATSFQRPSAWAHQRNADSSEFATSGIKDSMPPTSGWKFSLPNP